MDLQKTLTNAWRKLFPAATAVYDELVNAQNAYNNMSEYDKYKVRENIPEIYNQWIQRRIDNLEKDYQYARDIYDKKDRYIQEQRSKNNSFWLGGKVHVANYWYTRYNNDLDKIKELEWKKLVTNKELADFIPVNNSPLKEGNKQWTIDDIMWRMELIVLHDDYMKSLDRNYRMSKEEDEEWNGYKKQLKDLWVSFGDFRDWYYKQHPTKNMEAWDELSKKLNVWLREKAWSWSETGKKEAKKFIWNILSWMVNTWNVESNLDKMKELINLYNKLD